MAVHLEILFVSPFKIYDFAAFFEVDDRSRERIYEVGIVRNENYRCRDAFQGVEQDLFRIDVEVCRRLVEKKKVARRHYEFDEGKAHFFAAA